ncbi:MAG: hypothetical protein ACFE9T_02285 [Promethearchaeota archaeon]
MKKKKEDITYIYGGLEEFDDFKDIREREHYEIKKIAEIFRKYIDPQKVLTSTEILEYIKSIPEILKNNLNVIQDLNSLIIDLTTQFEKFKKKSEHLFNNFKLT